MSTANSSTPSGDSSDSNAPTTPLNGGTAPLGSGGGQGPASRYPRWQGRPTTQLPQTPGSQGAIRLSFRGQQQGETVLFVRRKHPLFLIIPIWPALLFVVGLIIVLTVQTDNVRLHGLLVILQFLFGLGAVIFTLKWFFADFIGWFFNIYVLTERRLIDAQGFVFPNRKEATLDRIQQVQITRHNIFDYALDIGNVLIVTAGSLGDLTFNEVAHPMRVADDIRAAEQAYRSAGRKADSEVEPKLPAVKKVLDELTKPVTMEAPPAAPERSFGGFLRRPADIRQLPNEVTTNYIFRHWFVLFRRELLPATILAVSLIAAGAIATFLHTMLWVVALVGVLVALVYGALVYINYADDVFVLTTDRIIDIDRFLFVFFEGRKQAEYSKVQDVRVNVRTIIGRLLNFGDITVETAGRLPNIEMRDIPSPFVVQDLIFTRINSVKERDAAAAVNRQRREYRRMLAATLNELVVEVPELRQLTLVEASERLDGIGLHVKVDSERRVRGVPPGVVVAQMPSAQTMVLNDSEVRVILSGR